MYFVWKYKIYRKIWWKNVKERGHLGVPGVDVRIILKFVNNRYIKCENID
jgi:hypothetical protein